MAQDPKSLTPEVFHQLKKNELKTYSDKVMTNCLNKVENTLTSFPFEWSRPDIVKKVAKEIIVMQKRSLDNAPQSNDQFLNEKRQKAVELYNMARVFNQAMLNYFLVLQPNSGTDSEYLRSHYSNICKIFPISDEREGITTSKTFSEYSVIKKYVTDFFVKADMKCKHVTVIFNGYISKQREFVCDHSSVNVDTCANHIIDCFKSYFNDRIMPYSLDIVYVENALPGTDQVHYSDVHVVGVTVEKESVPQHHTVTVYSKSASLFSHSPKAGGKSSHTTNFFGSSSSRSENFFGEESLARASAFNCVPDEEEIPGLDYVDSQVA